MSEKVLKSILYDLIFHKINFQSLAPDIYFNKLYIQFHFFSKEYKNQFCIEEVFGLF